MLTRLIVLACLFAVPLMTDEPKMRRLETLAWNPLSSEMSWTVTMGSKNDNGEYTPVGDPQKFTIDLTHATMEHNGAKRKFSDEEAANVAVVMGLISKYAQESTMWWEAGKGEPATDKEKVKADPSRKQQPGANWPSSWAVAQNVH